MENNVLVEKTLDAIKKGDCDVLEQLVADGLNPNSVVERGCNLFHYIVDSPIGNFSIKNKMCELLIAHEGNPNIHNFEGLQPLHHAMHRNNTGYWKEFIQLKGVDPMPWDVDYNTPLLRAKNITDIQHIFKVILKKHINYQDKDGNTVLHLHPWLNAHQKEFEEWGFDFNLRNKKGEVAVEQREINTYFSKRQ